MGDFLVSFYAFARYNFIPDQMCAMIMNLVIHKLNTRKTLVNVRGRLRSLKDLTYHQTTYQCLTGQKRKRPGTAISVRCILLTMKEMR